jgi:predicted NBD/HSP70 family sugar kinase
MAVTVSRKIAQKADRELADRLPFAFHGCARLPYVDVESYNIELRERGRFVGDRANKQALIDLVEQARARARKRGRDPFDDVPNEKLTRKMLERALAKGSSDAAGIVQSALDEFAQRLARVIVRYLHLPEWKKVEKIVVGGGLRASRLGQLAIGRAQVLLHERDISVGLAPIHSDPDDAGLMGSAYLAPSWIFAGYDALLAADIGGSNIRTGVIGFRAGKRKGMARVEVLRSESWRHADEEPTRERAVDKLVAMLKTDVRVARREKLKLAPFVGIGCPGRVRLDGAIDRGTQNLPGNWEADRFNLPQYLREHLKIARQHDTTVLMHNDAVVQGLSELPKLGGVKHWAVLTIGTGLGNAKFTTLARG